MAVGRTLARGLGVLSIGLGAVQLVAPRRLARLTGLPDRGAGPLVLRAVGVRELLAGGGLLAARWPVAFQWFRVAGDAMDLALVSAAGGRAGSRRPRAVVTLAALAGLTVADVLGGLLVSREAPAGGRGELLDERGRKPVRRSITIGRSRADVYAAWRDLEGLPRFMDHLEAVSVDGDGRSHWRARAPFGGSVEWDAELTEDRPGERIGWRSLDGAPVTHEGSVTFADAPGDRGTQLTVDFRYAPPAGPIGVAIAKVAGEEPEQQVADDLRRLKQLLEVGEVGTSASAAQSEA